MSDMSVFEDSSAMRLFSRSKRSQGLRIGFVPTMVRLSCSIYCCNEIHMINSMRMYDAGILARRTPVFSEGSKVCCLDGTRWCLCFTTYTCGEYHDCREQCDVVVASIYVNPTQFSKNEDFGVYPKSIVRCLSQKHEHVYEGIDLGSWRNMLYVFYHTGN